MAVKSGEERLKEMEAEMALWVQALPEPIHYYHRNYTMQHEAMLV